MIAKLALTTGGISHPSELNVQQGLEYWSVLRIDRSNKGYSHIYTSVVDSALGTSVNDSAVDLSYRSNSQRAYSSFHIECHLISFWLGRNRHESAGEAVYEVKSNISALVHVEL
jgi:hypothetical protein